MQSMDGIIHLYDPAISAWNCKQMAHTSTFLFLPQGWNYLSCVLEAAFEIQVDFQNFYVWHELSQWQKFHKFHIYFVSIKSGQNRAYLQSGTSSSKIPANFQIAIFGHETWWLPQVPCRYIHCTLFLRHVAQTVQNLAPMIWDRRNFFKSL